MFKKDLTVVWECCGERGRVRNYDCRRECWDTNTDSRGRVHQKDAGGHRTVPSLWLAPREDLSEATHKCPRNTERDEVCHSPFNLEMSCVAIQTWTADGQTLSLPNCKSKEKDKGKNKGKGQKECVLEVGTCEWEEKPFNESNLIIFMEFWGSFQENYLTFRIAVFFKSQFWSWQGNGYNWRYGVVQKNSERNQISGKSETFFWSMVKEHKLLSNPQSPPTPQLPRVLHST